MEYFNLTPVIDIFTLGLVLFAVIGLILLIAEAILYYGE